MISREINNAGSPLLDGAGVPLAGVVLSFQLVDIRLRPSDAFMTSGERVGAGKSTVTTDTNGGFSTTLPCTSSMTEARFWLCRVEGDNENQFREFAAPLPAGAGSLSFADFKAGA